MARIHCLVPGCRHTRGDRKNDPITPGMEWICGDHWKLVPRRLKAIRSRALRRYRNISASVDPVGIDRAYKADVRLWRRIAREAIERATGLK